MIPGLEVEERAPPDDTDYQEKGTAVSGDQAASAQPALPESRTTTAPTTKRSRSRSMDHRDDVAPYTAWIGTTESVERQKAWEQQKKFINYS